MAREETTRCKRKYVKHNSDFKLVNKSLDFKLNSFVSNGEFKRVHQRINSENFNNGRSSSDSFTQQRGLFSQPTDVRDRRQCGRLLRRNFREQSAIARKKPRILTAKSS